jgi:hypothetical protein
VSERGSEGVVQRLDKHSFYELVKPRRKDWLLYFHAPW